MIKPAIVCFLSVAISVPILDAEATNTTGIVVTDGFVTVIDCPPSVVSAPTELLYYCPDGYNLGGRKRTKYICTIPDGTVCKGTMDESLPKPSCSRDISNCLDEEYYDLCARVPGEVDNRFCRNKPGAFFGCWDKHENKYCESTLTPIDGATWEDPMCPWSVTLCGELASYGWQPRQQCSCKRNGRLGWFYCDNDHGASCNGPILPRLDGDYNGTCPPPVSTDCPSSPCADPLQFTGCRMIDLDQVRQGIYGCFDADKGGLACVSEIHRANKTTAVASSPEVSPPPTDSPPVTSTPPPSPAPAPAPSPSPQALTPVSDAPACASPLASRPDPSVQSSQPPTSLSQSPTNISSPPSLSVSSTPPNSSMLSSQPPTPSSSQTLSTFEKDSESLSSVSLKSVPKSPPPKAGAKRIKIIVGSLLVVCVALVLVALRRMPRLRRQEEVQQYTPRYPGYDLELSESNDDDGLL